MRLTEPVRLYLYGICGAALAVAVGYGLLAAEEAALWASLVVAVLAVPTTELVRSKVYAPATVHALELGQAARRARP